MSKRFVTVALLSTALVSGAAFAQSNPPASSTTTPSATTTTTTTSPTATTTTNKMDLKGKWRASKLIGLDVYNEANEKLGDINELILDKDGKINAVVIGVGGFLGMGEHDIAVTMDKLKFVEEPVRTSATTTTTTTERRDTTATAPATSTAPAATTGAASTAPARTTTTAASTYDWLPDHAVMSGTKEQLKALPQFKYSDYN